MALQTKILTAGEYSESSWSNGYQITLTLTEESVDFDTNTSEVSYHFAISRRAANLFYSSRYNWMISVAGQGIPVERFRFDMRENTQQTIASGHLTVPHHANGALDMPYTVFVPNVREDDSLGPPEMGISGTWELTPIPREISVFCPDGQIGQAVVVSVAGTVPGMTHTLTYAFGESGGVIAEKTDQTEISWTIPNALYAELPQEKTGTGVITCTAYRGDAVAGTSQVAFSAGSSSSSNAPVIYADVVDINPDTIALTGNAEILVRYCSHAKATAQCIAQNGAKIASYYLIHNGEVYAENPDIIYEVEKGAFRFNAIDTRGYDTSLTIERTLIPYVKLTCNLSDNKPDGDGNMTVKITGSYFPDSFGAEDNSLTVQYRFKLADGDYGAWITLPANVAVKSYSAQAELTGLDYQKAYVFQARAIDKLATVESVEYPVIATPVFDWDENDFNVNGTMKINNQPVEDFVVARGNTGIWAWERWNSGVAKCWGQTTEKTFSFLGSGPVYHSNTVHSTAYPFALTEITSISADIVSPGYVVPVVLSTEESVRTTFIRLYGTNESVKGYYTFTVLGRWK